MGLNRSQGDPVEAEQRREEERLREERRLHREEVRRIQEERERRRLMQPPQSPSQPTCTTQQQRPQSPTNASVRSHRTTSSTVRLRMAELEAAEKLAEIKRKSLEIEADLVEKRLSVTRAEIEEEGSTAGDVDNADTVRAKVGQWLQDTPIDHRRDPVPRLRKDEEPPSWERRERSQTPGKRNGIAELADAIRQMARPQRRMNSDLPTFSGAASEWLAFKAAVQDSTRLYNVEPTENLLRLRACLKGEARETVAALLFTATHPDEIMRTLEQSYGRPEIIIDRVLDDLRKLPKPGSSATEFNTFAVKVQNVVCTLRSVDRVQYLHNPMLTRDVLGKLSPHIRARWCQYADDHPTSLEPEIVLLSRFLMKEADMALRHDFTPTVGTTRTTPTSVNTASKGKRTAVYATNEREETPTCAQCEGAHTLVKCRRYLSLPVNKRWELAKEKGLCFRCLTGEHRRFNCKAKACGVRQCRSPHHATLHNEKEGARTAPAPVGRPSPATTPSTGETDNATVCSVGTNSPTGTSEVLLKVCPVTVSGPQGSVDTYALLDEGATITLIDEELAASVGANGPTRPLTLSGVNMSQREQNSQEVEIFVRGKGENALFKVKGRTIYDLTLRRQTVPRKLLKLRHLKDLRGEMSYERAQPRILVGADHWDLIVSRDLRIGGPNEPAASRTQLGWVVHGTAPRSAIYKDDGSVLHVYAPDLRVQDGEEHDRRLNKLVERHFAIDSLGVAPKPRVSDADQRANKIFEETVKKKDGEYEVGLPWRHDHVVMPSSYGAAANRLRGIEKKMDADPAFAREYTAQVENLLAKGYAVPCDGTETSSNVSWFLPHFAVENPNKPGKTRLVFDAAHRNRGVSLNDMLLEGPDLLLSLTGIIFRFRERAIAVTADVQEMFLRVKIRKEDQPAQQFLWRGADRTCPPSSYKMTSMIFGAASSPFLAHSVRDHNARAHSNTHPRALAAITRSHYMDDYVDSYDSETDARDTIAEVREVHAAAGFTLRGWCSNRDSVLNEVPSELRATGLSQLGGDGSDSKILGLYWHADSDELAFNTAMHRVPVDVRDAKRAPTKREALSVVMSIYDPLGLLSQYTIRAKIVLQSLWKLQVPWDDPLPEEEAALFAEWLRQLSDITRLRVPRCYGLESAREIELHVMCDASERAYATVAYFRATHSDGGVSVALAAAKAKVAPKRTLSIPRLELQAAVIGARLADTIKREHRFEIARTVYWTDAATVVHWIRNDTRRYTPFVAHRLGEISEYTHRDEWRWLPTELNVADDATRLQTTPIEAHDRWFAGPCFLRNPEAEWPTQRLPTEDDDSTEVLHTSERDETSNDWTPDPARFSTYERLVRATARALAFVDMCRRRATRLEHNHIERAERALTQRAQEESFTDELRRLRAGRPVARTSRLYTLDPVLEDGLLRVRGRIGASSAPIETQRPVILDGRHAFTRLLVLREHCHAGHANRERVTNDLRQRYWVVHLRPTVRAVERGCALCQVRKARPRAPTTGDLPRARVDPFHRPFTNCGLDYFGPMVVKIGRRREKRWGALFTCLTTRAVHLELVESLSTDSAIMALRRMAARRGWPAHMYSDNATNFKGADSELRRAYAEWTSTLRDEGFAHRMKWTYIPPGAPNQGGAWERLVRSVKTALAVTLREKVTTPEILRTLLVEAEYSINARPLTHVSVSPHDPEALTPNHFLLGTSMGLPTTGPCEESDRRVWRASQALADSFWQRWVREYLPTLVPRGEPANLTAGLKVGDIVVVVDPALPRNVWPIGQIQATYPGPDGGVRVADVRTRTGVFRRPTSKLAVLVKEEDEEATRATPGGGC